MWWLLLLACDDAANQLPMATSGPPPNAAIAATDPLVAGLPAHVRITYAGVPPGLSIRLVANDGTRGQGPCSPTGQPCLDLVAPTSSTADFALLTASGTLELTIDVPDTPRVGLQLMAFKGRYGATLPPFITTTVPDADRDGDGLLDTDERARGTDLWAPDTDHDGVSDGLEVAGGSDPLDPRSRPPEVCDNGADDDADGRVDCADGDCFGTPGCDEVCGNGADDDFDGLADCADADCFGTPGCDEVCDDGVDNDHDGFTDCEDDDCWGAGCSYAVSEIRAGTLTYREYYTFYSHPGGWDQSHRAGFTLDGTGISKIYNETGQFASSCSWDARDHITIGQVPWHTDSFWSSFQISNPRVTFSAGCAVTGSVRVTPRGFWHRQASTVYGATNRNRDNLLLYFEPWAIAGSSHFNTTTTRRTVTFYGSTTFITNIDIQGTWTDLTAVQPFVHGVVP